jgi:hypothetical protein
MRGFFGFMSFQKECPSQNKNIFPPIFLLIKKMALVSLHLKKKTE